ncbi:histone-like nucleoid-structuring protein Lsr2 [Phycicoccus flavus]|uniref:histone-like nucleoid-structuring protein Lsr2 n=1 Tax=Phycicoccus flavus TaxID=2502783 RepID=UPI000FEBA67E|nr:Lsr2 family protein [Phycicoccus flavus]NHA67963.1 Lsr2 family protein [Phycicoccus flavus]
MAQRTITVLSDDLDSTESDDVETVVFGLNGASYEIDLGPANRQKLDAALAPFLDKARRTGGRAPAKRSTTRRDAAQTAAIREWATANGYEVSRRGRIPKQVEEAYEQAT